MALLRHGYLWVAFKEGRPLLWVRTTAGYCSPALTQREIDDGKLPSLIQKIKKGKVSVITVTAHMLRSVIL